MIRKHHNHKLQTNPRHRKKESHHNHETLRRQRKQSNQLSLPHKDYCKLELSYSNVQQNKDQLHTPTMGVIINTNSTTKGPPPQSGQ